MRAFLNFVILSLSFIGVSHCKTHACDSKPFVIEEGDQEGFFRMFRGNPEDFKKDELKAFLERTKDLYSKDVTYENNGVVSQGVIYKRFFTSEGYYFTFLTRHNLVDETFLVLENIKVKFMKKSSSGFQTKLHYNIYLEDVKDLDNNNVAFSFRILYASKFERTLASKPLAHSYQIKKTKALAAKVARPASGNWEEAVKRQAEIEQQRLKTSTEKSEKAKKSIKDYFEGLSHATTPHSSSDSEMLASSSATPSEEKSMVRKFSKLHLPVPSAKSPPKKVIFDTAPQTKEGIEQQYVPAKLSANRTLERKSSRIILGEKKQHEEEFQKKKDHEERVDLIGRRSSITGKSPSSPRLNSEKVEQSQGPKSEPLISSPRSNTNQKWAPAVEKEALETSFILTEEERYGVSQDDIEELFEDISASE